MNRILNFNKNNGSSPALKQEYDQRRDQMRMKTVQESGQKLHKRMLDEIDKLVPEWRKRVCAWIWPRWLNNGLAIILSCLPPDPLIRWAVAPGIHMAYKWLPLLPLVILSSVIRMLIVRPLNFLKARVYLWGIKRDIKQIDEHVCELTLKAGKETVVFRQDWRYGEIRRVKE